MNPSRAETGDSKTTTAEELAIYGKTSTDRLKEEANTTMRANFTDFTTRSNDPAENTASTSAPASGKVETPEEDHGRKKTTVVSTRKRVDSVTKASSSSKMFPDFSSQLVSGESAYVLSVNRHVMSDELVQLLSVNLQ